MHHKGPVAGFHRLPIARDLAALALAVAGGAAHAGSVRTELLVSVTVVESCSVGDIASLHDVRCTAGGPSAVTTELITSAQVEADTPAADVDAPEATYVRKTIWF